MRQAVIYAYLLPLGEYDFDAFSDINIEISWFIFFLGTFIMNIMLLNLLISIISDTFARIKESYDVIMYKDMLGVINENRLFYWGDETRFTKY
mmetsp:Transcript_23091/g.22502  ORF Transcript_23091/g.22502 Transcript_23091/m.22502 type:complete len:93 (+) Transcript_23091:1360-1638(+)